MKTEDGITHFSNSALKGIRHELKYLLVDEPGGWEDQHHVGYHVDHGGPADGIAVHVVELSDYIVDDGELGPLHGVRHGVQHEDEQDGPTTFVLFVYHRLLLLLLHGGPLHVQADAGHLLGRHVLWTDDKMFAELAAQVGAQNVSSAHYCNC